MKRTARLSFVSVLLAAASPAAAQRGLHWEELKVAARLDADGRLHVTETQTMVLSGDWNGGERRFRLRPEQELELHRVLRLDPATGAWLSLRQGSLDSVDAYDWHDATTLRWRSRRPEDPPYREARLVYRLEYSYTNILQPAGGARAAQAHEYRLEHDFAFADRPGVIGHLTLDLELDPAWEALDPLPSGLLATNLPPGRGYVVRLALRHHGAVPPAGVDTWGPRVRLAAWAGLLFLPPLVLANAWWREQRLGRFAPLPAATRGFLEQTVLKAPPEVIGAAWDEQVGAAEVGAVIARLQAEGKLASRVEARPRVGTPELTLTLLRPLAEFEGYEASTRPASSSPSSRRRPRRSSGAIALRSRPGCPPRFSSSAAWPCSA